MLSSLFEKQKPTPQGGQEQNSLDYNLNDSHPGSSAGYSIQRSRISITFGRMPPKSSINAGSKCLLWHYFKLQGGLVKYPG